MKLKDGVKIGIGLALGASLYDVINRTLSKVIREFLRSDEWKEIYYKMSEDAQKTFESFKPEDELKSNTIPMGFQSNKSSGS